MAPAADTAWNDPAAEVAFLFIGGAHQVYHLAPVAAELSRLLPWQPITCFCNDTATEAALQLVRRVLEAPDMRIERVRPPLWGRLLAAYTRRQSSLKTPLLVSLSPRLRRAAAVVTPERTSAKLRRMGLKRSLMIHFRHGAGDRAPQSEERQAAFDLVVVPGEKDLRRAAEKGYLPPSRLRAGGYIKLEFFSRRITAPLRLFNNDRPVVLYNPHFDPEISSSPLAREVLAQFAQQSRYNLIFAPHLRWAENMSEAERAGWQMLAQPGRIVVDLGSPRLIDMSYAMAADIYLGDMSSQLYEFLIRPRPAAFLNAHGAAWRDNPRFGGWALGEVADKAGDVMAVIDRAVAGHAEKAAAQQAAVRDAFGEIEGAALRGAQAIAAAVAARAEARQGRRVGAALSA
jgi:hypothetical protein